MLRPFHNETHAGSSVYFETEFAYFADVIKRTFEMLPRRHLNPVGQERVLQCRQQPAIILSLKGNNRACCSPAVRTIRTVPRLAPGAGGKRPADGFQIKNTWEVLPQNDVQRLELGLAGQRDRGSVPNSTTHHCVSLGKLLFFASVSLPGK